MSFWGELRRRNVFKVGVAYAIVAWLIIQIVSTCFPTLQLPVWSVTLVTVLLIIGFPVALLLAWAYEVTPEGIKRTKQIPLAERITLLMRRKRKSDELASNKTKKEPVGVDVEEAPKTIAVLPFLNLSPDPDQEYFADGLSEELLNGLAQIEDLRVTARTSSFTFKGTNKKVQEIGNSLGVENILEGSVRKAGNTLRITAQLVRAVDGFHLWSKTYDRELKHIFAVQEDIAKTVANELKLTLGIDRSHRQLGDTDNEKAYELYLVGLGQENKGDYSLALKSIDATISVDPKFALAWTEKANIHIALSIWGPVNRVVTEQDAALSAAQRAIELEPKLGVAYIELGLVKTAKGNWIEAEFAYRKALELTTETLLTLSSIWIPIHYTAVGHYKRSLELLEAARRNDPLNHRVSTWYFFILGLLGDMRRAEEEYEHSNASSPHQYASDFITRLRLGTGNVVSRDEIVYSTPTFNAAKEYLDSPKEGLAELHKLYSDENNLSEADITDIMIWAACFGDPEFAMDAMEKGIKINAIGLFKIWLPVMRDVRQLPRFKEFVREIGLVDYWNEFGWPDLCRPLDNGDFECD